MLLLLWGYISGCFIRALRGSLSSALNWAGIIGVGVVGGFYEYRGLTMVDPHGWQAVVKWGLTYTAAAWAIIFAIRLVFVAPFQLFVAAKTEAALSPFRLREIETLAAHTEALQRSASAIEAQNRESDPLIKAHRERFAANFLPQPRVLEIEVGDNGPFVNTTGSGLYDIKRAFNIKLSNVHPHKTATNCKVYATAIEPQDEYVGPWLLKEMPSLASGEHAFIPLARYGEARNPKTYDCADTFFTTYLGSPGHPAFDVGGSYIFTLRATATDSPQCEFRCKLWVDEEGRFRIEKA